MGDQLLTRQFSAFRDGSRDAMAFFYKFCEQGVYSYLYRMTRDEAAAKDLFSEAFYVLMTNHAKIVNLRHLIGFLYRTALHLYLQSTRSRSNRLDSEREWSRIMETEAGLVADHTEFVYGVLDILSPRRKAVIRMRFLEGLSVHDISLRLGITEQTVRNTINQSLDILRRQLDDPRAEKFLRYY
jgi:RNA polymerase sigma factor (sigma-70 family)